MNRITKCPICGACLKNTSRTGSLCLTGHGRVYPYIKGLNNLTLIRQELRKTLPIVAKLPFCFAGDQLYLITGRSGLWFKIKRGPMEEEPDTVLAVYPNNGVGFIWRFRLSYYATKEFGEIAKQVMR